MRALLLSFVIFIAGSMVLDRTEATDSCPAGCKCEPIKDLWTYETEFTVSCSNLSLTEVLPFQGWQKVDVLDLTKHSISALRNHAFKGILPKKILLQDNNISVIEPDAFVDVTHVTEVLDLSSNKLEQIPQGITKLTKLKKLIVSNNYRLRLQKRSFEGLTSLETLDVTNLYMTSIPDETFSDVAGTLKVLTLFSNKLTSIPIAVQQLRNLEKIDFDSNPITYVPPHAFKGMDKLKELTLSRNEFSQPSSIHPLAFVDIASTLEELEFYYSDLMECPTEALTPLKKLKRLSFNSNKITTFPPKAFQALDSLEELTLDRNHFNFTREMFTGITDTVRMISIRGMGLTELPVHELAVLDHLQWVDASSNSFVTLGDNFTRGLSANRYTLQWMKIQNISPTAFAGKKRPIHLGLDDNKISSLDFVKDPCMYDYVEVAENPLVCDCHTLFVALHNDIVLAGTCRQPAEYANMDVTGEAFRQSASRNCGTLDKTVKNPCPHRDYNWNSGVVSLSYRIAPVLAIFLFAVFLSS